MKWSRLGDGYSGHMPPALLEIQESTKARLDEFSDFIYTFVIFEYGAPPDLLVLQTTYEQDFSCGLGYVNSDEDKTTYRTLDQAMNILLDRLEDWIAGGLYKDMYYD